MAIIIRGRRGGSERSLIKNIAATRQRIQNITGKSLKLRTRQEFYSEELKKTRKDIEGKKSEETLFKDKFWNKGEGSTLAALGKKYKMPEHTYMEGPGVFEEHLRRGGGGYDKDLYALAERWHETDWTRGEFSKRRKSREEERRRGYEGREGWEGVTGNWKKKHWTEQVATWGGSWFNPIKLLTNQKRSKMFWERGDLYNKWAEEYIHKPNRMEARQLAELETQDVGGLSVRAAEEDVIRYDKELKSKKKDLAGYESTIAGIGQQIKAYETIAKTQSSQITQFEPQIKEQNRLMKLAGSSLQRYTSILAGIRRKQATDAIQTGVNEKRQARLGQGYA